MSMALRIVLLLAASLPAAAQTFKPYESELKPLLQWWRSSRNSRMAESNTEADSRCSLSDAGGIFSN